MCVCVCVCVCMCMCARTRVCACVCACVCKNIPGGAVSRLDSVCRPTNDDTFGHLSQTSIAIPNTPKGSYSSVTNKDMQSPNI